MGIASVYARSSGQVRQPREDRLVGPAGVQAREIEAQALGLRPQVRILEAALIGEVSGDHSPW